MDWLNKYIFPAEAKTVSPEFVRAGTRLAALEMIQSGTTTFADMYYFEEEIAKETKAAGLRGVLGQTVIQFPVADAKTPADGAGARRGVHHGVQGRPADHAGGGAARDVHARRSDAEGGARAVAAPRRADADSSRRDARRESRRRRSGTSTSPVAYLDSLGFLGPGVLAAHGVWVTDADIAMLKARGVGVSHNPESNMKLASGTAPVPAYLRAGVALGLGTDGAASNNDLDMFEAMRHGVAPAQAADRRSARGQRARRRSRWRRLAARARSAWSGRSARSSRASAPT